MGGPLPSNQILIGNVGGFGARRRSFFVVDVVQGSKVQQGIFDGGDQVLFQFCGKKVQGVYEDGIPSSSGMDNAGSTLFVLFAAVGEKVLGVREVLIAMEVVGGKEPLPKLLLRHLGRDAFHVLGLDGRVRPEDAGHQLGRHVVPDAAIAAIRHGFDIRL